MINIRSVQRVQQSTKLLPHYCACSLLSSDSNTHATLHNNSRWGVKTNSKSQAFKLLLLYEQLWQKISILSISVYVRKRHIEPPASFVRTVFYVGVFACVCGTFRRNNVSSDSMGHGHLKTRRTSHCIHIHTHARLFTRRVHTPCLTCQYVWQHLDINTKLGNAADNSRSSQSMTLSAQNKSGHGWKPNE